MKHKIITSFLVTAFAASLGFDTYHYFALENKQKLVNDIQSEIILEWADKMYVASSRLKNATTNVDISDGSQGVRWFLLAAFRIVTAGYQGRGEAELYEPLIGASLDVAGILIRYQEGAENDSIVERNISQAAIEMFGILADKILNVTQPIFNEAHTLYGPSGIGPKQRLEGKGMLDCIVDSCREIEQHSYQIHGFSPKFQ